MGGDASYRARKKAAKQAQATSIASLASETGFRKAEGRAPKKKSTAKKKDEGLKMTRKNIRAYAKQDSFLNNATKGGSRI